MSTPAPHTGNALGRAWPGCALALWATAWRAGAVAPDEVLHTLGDYAQTHELDAGPGTGVASSAVAIDVVRLVRDAAAVTVALPVPGDAQGLPPGVLDGPALAGGEVLLLARPDGAPLHLTARGTAERCRWTVRALQAPLDVGSVGVEQPLGELEYELREAIGDAAAVLAELAGPRTGGPADLRDALAARTAARALDLPPHDRLRVDRVLAQAAQVEAIVDLAGPSSTLRTGGGLGASATHLDTADTQLRRLTNLTRQARAAAVNTLLRDYVRDL